MANDQAKFDPNAAYTPDAVVATGSGGFDPNATYEPEQAAAKPGIAVTKPSEMEHPIDRLISWFTGKKQAAEEKRLSDAAKGGSQTVQPQSLSPGVRQVQEQRAKAGEPGLPADVGLYGAAADTATLAKQMFTPKGALTAAATAVAPEVMLPYMTYTGAREAMTPQQPGEDQPGAVQRRLLGASQAAASGAGTGAMVTGELPTTTGRIVKGVQAAKVAGAPAAAAAADADLIKALGPTKTNPITDADVKAARPFLEEQHANDPVTKEGGVLKIRDHADSGIERIENHIDGLIAENPTDTIGGHAKPLDSVKKALAGNVKKNFVADGLKAIDEYKISDDMTVQDAEAVRKQLNADNRSAMKAKNNYDLANMRTTDPAFAAREALANSLRDGIYGKLEQRGAAGVRELRQAEGSLIKVRNAAQAREFQGEAKVGGTEKGGRIRQALGKTVKLGATAKGAALGGAPGAVVGSVVGDIAEGAVAPGKLSRNELSARAFKTPQTKGPQLPQVSARPAISGQLPAQTPAPIVTPQPGASVQTPAEVQAQAAAQKSANTPGRRIVRDPETGKMKIQYTTAGGGEVTYPPKAEAPAAAKPKVTAKDVADYLNKKRAQAAEEDATIELIDPETVKVRNNASGESSSSLEDQTRAATQKAKKIEAFRIDTRSGLETKLLGSGTDIKAGPFDVIVKRGPHGEEIIDSGSKARPYRSKGKQ